MENIDNSLLIRRAVKVGEVLQELTAVEPSTTGWRSEYPRNLKLAFETGLCLTIVSMKGLSANKALRYIRMVGKGTTSENEEEEGEVCDFTYLDPGDEEWSSDAAYAPLDAYLYVGPPEATLFYTRALPASRVNFVLAYEVGSYLADVLSYYSAWSMPRARQCAIIWDALDPTPAQHELWLDLRAMPRIFMAKCSDFPSSVLNLAVPHATATEVIARELLAPWAEVSALYCAEGCVLDRHGLVSLLMEQYRLPAAVASRYCNDLRTLVSPKPARCTCTPPCWLPMADPPLTMQNLHWGEETADEPE